jgi:hypothetical protein
VTTNAVMTSVDGIVWTAVASPLGAWWRLAWAPETGAMVAVGTGGAAVMSQTLPRQLTGIPPSGAGSIGVPILKGASVNIWVTRDDLAAQTAMALIDGGDGLYEFLISDERRGEASLTALCDADLARFSMPIVTVTYASRDRKTKVGKTIVVNLASPPISETLVIQDVTITEIDVAPNVNPKFTVTASSVRFSLEDLLRRALVAAAP